MCSDEGQRRLGGADLEKLAEKRRAELMADGVELHPVVSRTRKLAGSFWGSAWMRHLACCEAGGLCLAPGRTLLRHGCVLDVRVSQGDVQALVSAEELYEIELRLSPPDEERVESLSTLCCGHIDSLISLLEGRLEPTLLQRLCHAEYGLLPDAADWRMRCSCPDWAEPCPHAAAVMYAVGVLLDTQPELLFVLRGINPEQLIRSPEADSQAFDAAALEATFGIELDVNG